MPRNVRNFWVTVDVDGKATRVATGPRGKAGGMDITLYQRDAGEVVKVCDILCRCNEEGTLSTEVVPSHRAKPEMEDSFCYYSRREG